MSVTNSEAATQPLQTARLDLAMPRRVSTVPRAMRRYLLRPDFDRAGAAFMPPMMAGFISGGVETNAARGDDRAAFQDYAFIPSLDGGVRRGTDVLKALGPGRAFRLPGLALPVRRSLGRRGRGGAHAIQLLAAEIDRNLALPGLCDLGQMRPEMLKSIAGQDRHFANNGDGTWSLAGCGGGR